MLSDGEDEPANDISQVNNQVQNIQEITVAPQYWANLIIEGVDEVLFSVDRQWRLTYFNQKAATVLNRTPATILGKIFWEEFPLVVGSSFENLYRRAMGENKPARLEDYWPVDRRWYDVRAYPIPEGLIISYQDITERKQLEQTLEESQSRFRVLSEAAYEGIIIHKNGVILEANQNAISMFGYKDFAEFTLQRGWDIFAPESESTLLAHAGEDYDEPVSVVCIRKDGSRFPAEVRGKFIEYHGQTVRIAAIKNITLRHQYEQKLRESEERFRVLSEASFDAVIIHENAIILEANQAALNMTGYSREEFVNQPLTKLFTSDAWQAVQQYFISSKTNFFETSILRKDGTTFPAEGQRQRTIYQGREVSVSSIRDISPQKELLKTQAQLLQSQKMESIGRLAGGIAHDFNNLLTVVINYSELGQLLLNNPEKVSSAFNEIQLAADRAAALTRQLLAFSRQQILQPSVVDLNQIVINIINLLQRLIPNNIDLVTIPTPDLGKVLVDPNQIEQILVNLVVNARDAIDTLNGGKITIETANVELDEKYSVFQYPKFKSGPYVLLAVSDNGCGMDEATQEKIFEPFFTTKEAGKGTGLGLSTVFGIVKQSEGYIWVYSNVGVGTTFKIYLPMVEEVPALVEKLTMAYPEAEILGDTTLAISNSIDKIPPASEKKRNSYRILVVEDETMVSELIRQILEQAGYTVTTVSNGYEALALIKTDFDKVDLMLTDIIMPRKGGQELITEIRAQALNLKIIGMSGYTDQAVQRHKLLEQYDSFIQKPFTQKLLLSRIEEVLNSR